MKIRVLIAVVLAALAASMLAGAGLAGGGGPGPATKPVSQSPYYQGLVETRAGSTGAGDQLSMTRDPLTGRIYIAYYDPALQALRLAAEAKTGQGNCGDGNNWYCTTIETPASNHSTGLSPSIAVYHGEFGFRVGIAYIDNVTSTTTSALKYAEFYASPTTLYSVNPSQWTWVVQVLDNQQNSHPSLKIDNLGAPHIAFEQISGVTRKLRYASPPEGSSGSGCINSDAAHLDWYCVLIRDDNTTGSYLPSLGIGADNLPRIAYYHSVGGTHYVSFAIEGYPTVGNCGELAEWECSDITTTGQVNNLELKVYIVNGGSYSHIAYIDGADNRLKYALYVSSASTYANCGMNPPQDWMCEPIAAAGPGALGLSIEVDRTGNPLIAYELADEIGPSSLYLAQAGPGTLKNCLSIPGAHMSWTCNPIAVPASGYVSIGFSNSIAIDNYGLGAIAYTSYDEYYETTSVHLAAQKTYTYLPMVHR